MALGQLVNVDWRGRLIRYAPLIFMAAVIIYLGSGAGSLPQTSRIIGPLLQFFFPEMTLESRALVHVTIRKLAHFLEYAALGFLAARAFGTSSVRVLNRWWPVAALAAVASIALLDEFLQSMSNTRIGSAYDVMIDLVGGFVAVAIVGIFRMRQTRVKRR